MASSCRCNVNFARKCSLTHLQAQRKFTSAGCHPPGGWYCNSIQYLRTVRTYSTFVQYVYTVRTYCIVHVPVSCTHLGVRYTVQYCVYPARRKCQIVELLRQRKKAAESCSGNLRRMPFRDVNDGMSGVSKLVSCFAICLV